MKPKAPLEYRGQFQPIATTAPLGIASAGVLSRITVKAGIFLGIFGWNDAAGP